jgi:hypothetical protein
MKTYSILFIPLLFLATLQSTYAEVWGSTGHRVIGAVAQKHLTPKAAEQVNALLGGMSLAFVSTYADEIRSEDRYDHLAPWHYVNMNQSTRYSEADKNPKGDIVTAIQTCVEILKNPTSSQEDKAFHLKLLVHFIGDIHQPFHAGRKEDRGGNSIDLFWFGKRTNLHRLWDTDLIEHYNMSYSELAAHLPKRTSEQKSDIMAAPLLDWVNQSQDLANILYEKTPQGARLGYVYHYQNFETVREQLLDAGLRLAATLNAIFDPAGNGRN